MGGGVNFAKKFISEGKARALPAWKSTTFPFELSEFYPLNSSTSGKSQFEASDFHRKTSLYYFILKKDVLENAKIIRNEI